VRRSAAIPFAFIVLASPSAARSADDAPIPVTVHNFARAETDFYFGGMARDGGFGKLHHRRAPASVDEQDVVRMNRDTLYSSGVFDLDAAPVTIALPDPGKRFMSMQVVSQDHYAIETVYGPGRFSYDRVRVGTRYVAFLIRTLANAENAADLEEAHALQDAIVIQQARIGSLVAPRWDAVSQGKARDALSALGQLGGVVERFGTKEQVDPVDHLIGTAIGWGGNPRSAADYQSFYPARNDGKTAHRLTVKDVPVDGFWSVSVYNAKGYFEKNGLGAYSLNNLTARAGPDGSVTIQFGGCNKDTPNCLPIVQGWNYTARLYRPRREVLEGRWTFPEAQPAN
jgi:para-nitrobenzyl esterase